MRSTLLLVVILIVACAGNAFAAEKGKKTKNPEPAPKTEKFIAGDYSMCKALSLETSLYLFSGSLASTSDVIQPLLKSCEGSDCDHYRQISQMFSDWDLSAKGFENTVAQRLWDTGLFDNIYLGAFGFSSAAKANRNDMQRCAIKVDMQVEIGTPSRVEVKYELGRHFYPSETQGGYLLHVPAKFEMPTLVPTYSGSSSRYAGNNDRVPVELNKMANKVVDSIIDNIKGQK